MVELKKYICGIIALMFVFLVGSPVASAENTAIMDARGSVVRLVMLNSDGSGGTGSAFAVGKKGEPVQYFITCDHCVSNEGGEPAFAEIYVVLNNWNDESTVYPASVVYCTNQMQDGPDMAVIKLEKPITGRTPIALQTKDHVKVSDEVYAIGFPGGADVNTKNLPSTIEDMTVTRGIISKLSLNEGQWSQNYQTDAAINHGNSGGPLVNQQGAAVGISAFFINGVTNINGAVQIDNILPILDRNHIQYELAGDSAASSAPSSAAGSSSAAAPVSSGAANSAPAVSSPVSQSGGGAGFLSGVFTSTNLPWLIAIAVAVIVLLLILVLFTQRRGGNVLPVPAPPVQEQRPAVQNAAQYQPELQRRAVLQGTGNLFYGKSIDLTQGKIIIGRDPQRCNLVFPAETPGISAVHCEISFMGGAFLLRDLGSTYGTFLANGVKLNAMQEQRLSPNSSFYLAASENSFTINLI